MPNRRRVRPGQKESLSRKYTLDVPLTSTNLTLLAAPTIRLTAKQEGQSDDGMIADSSSDHALAVCGFSDRLGCLEGWPCTCPALRCLWSRIFRLCLTALPHCVYMHPRTCQVPLSLACTCSLLR
ncbi:hypothetical protein HBI24_113210 [Parastagonospora nodorum]|nr:hypothetical protein HBI09_116400 [Parastagonospora nodorum]KAH5007676.1 hypothetical protein HBI77_101420 [Parastagonospora nodorum]KAH5395648.1 hypothetical protein HBI32_206380 [Parastagonospora nodorum]KAH5583096.1 hypothetical protein HBI24_113210 [Parastagonospora nodorum]KAH5985709.1 hypothetical protein HBI84_223960 [Parastagonospora nodorum]